MDSASRAGRLLRRDGAESGGLQEDQISNSDDYRTLRRRSARGVYVLQETYAVRNGGSEGKPFPDHRAVGPRGNTDAEKGGGWTEIWRSECAGPEQAAHGVVRLDDEEREDAGVFEEARGVLRGRRGRGKLEIRRQSRDDRQRE